MTSRNPAARSQRKRQGACEDGLGPLGDLRDEIRLLRATIQRVGRRLDGGDEMETEELLKIMEGLARSAVRLAGLIKAQRVLDEQTGGADVLAEALDEAIRELGLG